MFNNLFKRRSEDISAAQLYSALLSQSRQPQFFGEGRYPDDYDGRIEVLSLHLGLVMHSLRRFDEKGGVLSQALYDVMIQDFDIAMREEGLADTGIARRIKPMVALFYDRAKAMAQSLETEGQEDREASMAEMISGAALKSDVSDGFTRAVADYFIKSAQRLEQASYEQIERADITLAPLP